MNICVFCGSATGQNPVYAEAARELGKLLASRSIRLIYGGGNVGLMGVVADSVMSSGGEVIGIIPDFLLKREVGHRGITSLEVVQTMHERKKRMADLADAFIALPGGLGTLEELAEVLTWKQLGLINSPIAILNTDGFFNHLQSQFHKMIDDGFLKADTLSSLLIKNTPHEILSALR